jgi:hypothetical protein
VVRILDVTACELVVSDGQKSCREWIPMVKTLQTTKDKSGWTDILERIKVVRIPGDQFVGFAHTHP